MNNIAHIIQNHAKNHPDHEVLIWSESKKGQLFHTKNTYGEAEERGGILASSLDRLQIKRGDRVLLLVPMSKELYEILLAIFKIGAVAVVIDTMMSFTNFDYVIKKSNPKVVLGIKKAFILSYLTKNFKKIPLKICIDTQMAFMRQRGIIGYQDLFLETHKFPITDVDKEWPAIITFTSGSTGQPKGVARSHGFLKTQSRILTKDMFYEDGDIEITGLPIFALNNFAEKIPTLIPVVPIGKLNEKNAALIVQQIEDNGVNRATGSPFFFEQIARYCINNNKVLALKNIFTGGGPVTDSLLLTLRKVTKANIYIVYGSTEAEPIAMITFEDLLSIKKNKLEEQCVCVGTPIEDIKARIIKFSEGHIDFNIQDSSDYFLDKYQIGEIIVTGDHVNRSYYKNSEAVKQNKIPDANNSLWHRTGDFGFYDNNGRIWLAGRKEQLLIDCHANYHHSVLFEDQLKDIKGADSIILMISGGANYAFVKRQSRQDKKQITDMIRQKMISSDIDIRDVIFIKKIPLDKRHNSKVAYGELKKFIP